MSCGELSQNSRIHFGKLLVIRILKRFLVFKFLKGRVYPDQDTDNTWFRIEFLRIALFRELRHTLAGNTEIGKMK